MLKENLKNTLNVLLDLDERFVIEVLDTSEIADIDENIDSLGRLHHEIEELLKKIQKTDKKYELLELFIKLHKRLSVFLFYLDQVTSMVKVVMWKLHLNQKSES